MSHDAQFRVVDGDAGPLQSFADGAIDIYLFLLVVCLRSVQGGLGQRERAFRIQRIEAGFRAELLFLFSSVKGLLGKVARFLSCVNLGLSLFKRKLSSCARRSECLSVAAPRRSGSGGIAAQRGIDLPWPGGCAD